MKANNVKAIVAMSEFFTFNTTPEELSEILARASRLEDTVRDREIMCSLGHELAKALGM